MPRILTSGMLAAIQSGIVRPAFFVTLTFNSGVANLWTGYGSITWNSITWQGQGKLMSISPIEEGSTVQARGISVGLSGIATDLLSDAMTDFKIGAPMVVYFGCFDASAAVIADPVQSWAGRMDKPTVQVIGSTATINVNCETRLIDMNNAVDRRRTNDDQVQLVPGDGAFQFVFGLMEQNITWGTTTTNTNNI